MIHDCIACQHGAHDEHIDVPGPVQEGVIGGWVCGCKGECRDRPQPKPTFIEDVTDYAALSAQWPPRPFRETDLPKETT